MPPQLPGPDQSGEKCSSFGRRDQLWASVGVAEAGKLDGDDAPHRCHAIPHSSERPHGLGPRRQHQHRGIGVGLGVSEADPDPVTDPEVGGDLRGQFICYGPPPANLGTSRHRQQWPEGQISLRSGHTQTRAPVHGLNRVRQWRAEVPKRDRGTSKSLTFSDPDGNGWLLQQITTAT